MTDTANRALVARTTDGFERLFDFLDAIDQNLFAVPLDGGWTVSAVLAHLAFWDRWVEERWRRYATLGRFDDLPDDIDDLANAAARDAWLAVPAQAALAMARQAAATVTSRIESLPLEAVRAAVDSNREALVDRTRHWRPHLDDIRRAVSSDSAARAQEPPPDHRD